MQDLSLVNVKIATATYQNKVNLFLGLLGLRLLRCDLLHSQFNYRKQDLSLVNIERE